VHKPEELLSVATTIQSDVLFTKDLKMKRTKLTKTPSSPLASSTAQETRNKNRVCLKNYVSFLLEFFTRVIQQTQEWLHWYKNKIEQTERELSSAVMQAQSTPQVISSTLQARHAVFISLAAKIAAVDGELQKVKAFYTQIWCTRTGRVTDPFHSLDRGNEGDGIVTLYMNGSVGDIC